MKSKELEALAEEYANKQFTTEFKYLKSRNQETWISMKEAFIAGYKAKEEAGEEEAVDGWIKTE